MKNVQRSLLIELALVLVILGVTALYMNMTNRISAASNDLERAANMLRSELRAAQTLSVEKEVCVKASFAEAAAQCTILTADSCTIRPPAYRTSKIHRFSPAIVFRTPDSIPAESAPPVEMTTAFFFSPDTNGNVCTGGVYLTSKKVAKTGYFVGIHTAKQSIEVWKYNRHHHWQQL